jgi:hypothetical protein
MQREHCNYLKYAHALIRSTASCLHLDYLFMFFSSLSLNMYLLKKDYKIKKEYVFHFIILFRQKLIFFIIIFLYLEWPFSLPFIK